MNITFTNSTEDILGPIPDGVYELADGADVRSAMDAIFARAGREMSESAEANIIFVVDGVQAQWDSVLHEGDSLRVFFRFMGG